jgi:hypothetical protein
MEGDASLLAEGNKRNCPLCKCEMEDLVKVFSIYEDFWLEIGGSGGGIPDQYRTTPSIDFHNPKSRRYKNFECPQCGLFLIFRTRKHNYSFRN